MAHLPLLTQLRSYAGSAIFGFVANEKYINSLFTWISIIKGLPKAIFPIN